MLVSIQSIVFFRKIIYIKLLLLQQRFPNYRLQNRHNIYFKPWITLTPANVKWRWMNQRKIIW